ncbi:MAG: hypothetical protein R2710_04295 [Acidimicrobiales bacterium]
MSSADFDGDGTPELPRPRQRWRQADRRVQGGATASPTPPVIPGPYGVNGWADSVEVADSNFDTTNATRSYSIQNADGGTDDFLENADVAVTVLTSAVRRSVRRRRSRSA